MIGRLRAYEEIATEIIEDDLHPVLQHSRTLSFAKCVREAIGDVKQMLEALAPEYNDDGK
jgi:hypothetical protein